MAHNRRTKSPTNLQRTATLAESSRALRAAVALAVLGSSACSSIPEEPQASKRVGDKAEPSASSITYRHPLSELSKVSPAGALPIFDRLNSPSGKRYAMGDTMTELANHVIVRESGVFEIEREPASADERRPRTAPAPYEVVSARLRAAALAEPAQDLVFEVHLRKPGVPPLTYRLQEAVARGQIKTRGDRQALRARLVAERGRDVMSAQDLVAVEVERLRGKVLSRCASSYCLTISLPGAELDAFLDAVPNVVRVDPPPRMTEESVNGENMAAAIQVNQFYPFPGYEGWNAHPTGADVAQYEPGMAATTHRGYRNCAFSRILASYYCDSSCSTNLGSASTTNHASAVAGLMIGDLTCDQDPNVTGSSAQVQRSGYARDGQLTTYAGSLGYTAAMSHLVASNDEPAILNMSASDGSDDSSCTGQTTASINANNVFEDGIAFFKSAGNAGNSSTTNCTVTSPGSAIGVMPIGNHGNSGNYTAAATGETEIRTNGIASDSSRGGTSSQGGGRSIIGVTAYGCRTKMFDTSGGYGYNDCGTSFAAPTVVGSALDFMDHYKEEVGDLIDDPGVLYSAILLMGDRQGESGKLTSGFDGLWGAGRLRMRRNDDAGIDGPGAMSLRTVCISDGENYNLEFNAGNAMGNDVNTAKAVIWWYDPAHETGGGVDNVDLRIQTYNTATSAWETKRSSTSTGDNKERVYLTSADLQGKKVRLRITGSDVTNDTTCPGESNTMKVYLAYLWEDSDRDDAEGPGDEIFTE